jgi:murein DD-endopeptidase MepM/ murein hydrolase activator NlpD
MVSLKNDAYGLYVILGHMEKVSPDLRVGAWVEPFAFLGWSDNTGNSTGPHLHLEVRSGSGYYPYPSSCINPRPMLVWYSQAPSPQPPPKPNPSPPPIPPPTPVGWYKARTTQEIRLYTKQKFNTMVNYPRIAVGYDLMVSDRKQNGSEKWVILENGYFTLKRNGSQIYLRKV